MGKGDCALRGNRAKPSRDYLCPFPHLLYILYHKNFFKSSQSTGGTSLSYARLRQSIMMGRRSPRVKPMLSRRRSDSS
ncbi:MAG TPA: hypothetical protein [Caudoviricetes sp.]|nr:MAG TPA: hypothetical protein [Caudoviricetes sp.]